MGSEFRFRIIPELDEAAVNRIKNNLKFPDSKLKLELDLTALKDKLAKLQADYNANKQVIKEINAELKSGATLTDAQRQAYEVAKSAAAQQKKEIAETKRLISEATSKANELKSSFEKAGEVSSDMVTRFAKVGLALQGVQQISATFDQFLTPYAEFDKQLRNIGTLGVKNFEEFRDAAMNLASQVPDSVAGIAEAIYNAISAGAVQVVDGQAQIAEGMKFVETASKLAVAGLTDTNSAVKSLASVTNAYGAETLSASQAADILFATVRNGVTTVPELNATLYNVVPIAAAAGVSFEQVGAAIATLTKAGTPTAQATTQIRAAIAELMRPGANLAKVMKEAGVSIETLRKEGLQETMRKIGETMKRMGTDAANTFSSIEAIGFVLASTGENAEKAAADLEAMKTAAGSVDAAFEVASQGIDVTVQKITKQVQLFFFDAFDKIGDGAVVAMSAVNKLAPTVTSFAALKTLIPDNAIANVKTFATNIASKLVPSLSAATAGQKAFNLAMLANPYVIAIAGVAGLVTGLHYLSEAFRETAQERLDAANAEMELLKQQAQMNQQQMKFEQSNLQNVEAFKRQGEKAMENKALLLELSKAYPGVIDMTKSYSENLANLEKAADASKNKIASLKNEMNDIMNKQYELDVKTANLKVDTQEENIKKLFVDEYSNWLNKAAEYVFGSSAVTDAVDKYVKKYTEAIKKAKDDKELQKATMEFQMAIMNDKQLEDMSAKTRQQLVAQIEEMGKARGEALRKIKRDLLDEWNRGIELGLAEKDLLDDLSKKYNMTHEQIQEMIKKQQQSKAVTDAQAQAARDLAGAWDAVRKKTDEALNKQLAEANALKLRLKTENLSDAEKKKIEEEYNLKMKLLKDEVKMKKQLDAIDEENQIKAGLRAKSTASSSKSATENILQEYEAMKSRVQQEQRFAELIRENARLEAGVQKTVQDDVRSQTEKIKLLEQQKQKLAEIAAKYGGKIEGDKIVGLKLDKSNKDKLLSEFSKINDEIKEANLIKEGFEIKARIEDTKFDEQMKELERKAKSKELEFKLKVGLITATDYHQETMNLLAQDLENLQNKVQEINQKKIKFEYDKGKLIELDNELAKIQDEIAKTQEEINKSYAEYSKAMFIANLNDVKDNLERERQLKLYENAVAYNEQLKQAKGNKAKQLAIIEEFAKKEAEIQREYNNKTVSEIGKSLIKFSEAFRDETKSIKFEVNDSEAKAKIAEVTKNIENLDKSYKNGELSYADYVNKLNELDDERNAALKSKNETLRKELTKSFVSAFEKSIEASINSSAAALDATIQTYQSALDQIEVLKERTKSTFDAEELSLLYQQIEENSQKAADAMSNMWQQVGNVAALTFAQMIASGKSFQKSMVLAMLAGLKASVPIIVAKILGKELAEKGLLGIASSSILTGLFYAAIAKAEAAAKAAKFEKGGEIPGGEQLIRVNEKGTEFVVNHIAYSKNKKVLNEINRRNITFEQYAREKGLLAAKHEIKIDTSRLEKRLEGVERAIEEVEMAIHSTTHRNETFVKMEFNDKEIIQRYDVYRRNKLKRF